MEHLDPAFVHSRFPLISDACRRAGLDLARDRIPVGPAAHYMMGGVQTDHRRPHVDSRSVRGRARWHAPACTAPTGWRATRCSRGWCSAPARAVRCGTIAGWRVAGGAVQGHRVRLARIGASSRSRIAAAAVTIAGSAGSDVAAGRAVSRSRRIDAALAVLDPAWREMDARIARRRAARCRRRGARRAS